MERICPIEYCTGCMACYNSCSHEAIIETEDVCGFKYPVIDKLKCIDCGLCKIVCPVNRPVERQRSLTIFAAYSRDKEDRMSSTSGGASSVFAQIMVQLGGVVYGCVQHSFNEIKHQRIDKEEDLWRIKGSKYVQSEIGDVFKSVKCDLISGKRVLFTGTPCQVAGLRSFLRKDYPELLTIDLVCHGVPSRKLLKDDIQNIIERNAFSTDCKVFFRKKGDNIADLKFGVFLSSFGDEEIAKVLYSIEYPFDYYIAGFMCGLFYRTSCYTCTYANDLRCSDVTIGDYWGLGESDLDIGRGISAVLINSDKGKRFFELCKDKFEYEERDVEEAIRGNGQLQMPSVKNKNYDLFRQLYPRVGFKCAAKRCLRSFYRDYYWNELKKRLRKNVFIYRMYKLLKGIN